MKKILINEATLPFPWQFQMCSALEHAVSEYESHKTDGDFYVVTWKDGTSDRYPKEMVFHPYANQHLVLYKLGKDYGVKEQFISNGKDCGIRRCSNGRIRNLDKWFSMASLVKHLEIGTKETEKEIRKLF